MTDAEGEGYEHFTYTPYGEAWVEEHLSSKIHRMSHRFTGQELDPETGLYAFPARNYDPRTSRWLSADPALEEYLPEPGQKPGDLVGMGGVFNHANLAVYHYGGNNPLKYVDPTGEFFDGATLGKVAAKVMTKGVAVALAGLAAIALGIGAGVAAGNAISRAITQNQQQNEPQAAPQTAPVTAPARARSNQDERQPPSIRIQVQENTRGRSGKTLATSGGIAGNQETGVTTRQALDGTQMLRSELAGENNRMANSPQFRSAIERLDARIQSTPGVPDGQNVLQETFTYRGTEYRIDLDSYRGNGRNLSQ